ncbi:MAG: PP2C family serine/threonine-protein phosphatase [Alphaproteobacteria bacterium]
MTNKKNLLNGQDPVPPHAGDDSRDIAFGSGVVQMATFKGGRPYQEDRYLVDTLDITAGAAKVFLAEIFTVAAKKTDANRAGSTGTALVITSDLQLRAAYLGDSPAVIFVHDPATGDITAQKLTRDHHAAMPAEKARIERAGGYVGPSGRVDDSLMLSRAFGDAGYLGVSRKPEFSAADLKKEIDAGKDVYICLSSDGLYETLDPDDYIAPLQDAIAQKKDGSLADIFAAYAHEKGSADNITALVVKVPRDMKENLFLAIADGHGGSKTSTQVIEVFEDCLKKRKAAPKP